MPRAAPRKKRTQPDVQVPADHTVRDAFGGTVIRGYVVDAVHCTPARGGSAAANAAIDDMDNCASAAVPVDRPVNALFALAAPGSNAPVTGPMRTCVAIGLYNIVLPTWSPLVMYTVVLPATGEYPYVETFVVPPDLTLQHAAVLNTTLLSPGAKESFTARMNIHAADGLVRRIRTEMAYSLARLASGFRTMSDASMPQIQHDTYARLVRMVLEQGATRVFPQLSRCNTMPLCIDLITRYEPGDKGPGTNMVRRDGYIEWQQNTDDGPRTPPPPQTFAERLAAEDAMVVEQMRRAATSVMRVYIGGGPPYHCTDVSRLLPVVLLEQMAEKAPQHVLPTANGAPVLFAPSVLVAGPLQNAASMLHAALGDVALHARFSLPDVRCVPRYTRWPLTADLLPWLGMPSPADRVYECCVYGESDDAVVRQTRLSSDLPSLAQLYDLQRVPACVVVRCAEQLTYAAAQTLCLYMKQLAPEMRVVLLGCELLATFGAARGGSAYTLLRQLCGLTPIPLAPPTLFGDLAKLCILEGGPGAPFSDASCNNVCAIATRHGCEILRVNDLDMDGFGHSATERGGVVIADRSSTALLSAAQVRIGVGVIVATVRGHARVLKHAREGETVIGLDTPDGNERHTVHLYGAQQWDLMPVGCISDGVVPVTALPENGRVTVYARSRLSLSWPALLSCTLVPPERWSLAIGGAT